MHAIRHHLQHSGISLWGKRLAVLGVATIAFAAVLTLVQFATNSQAVGAAKPFRAAAVEPAAGQAAAVRIGIYDSRAVAVGYARSEQCAEQMKDLRRQHAEAQKAGDQKLVERLEARGESMQIRLNLQGFSTAPVDDVLDAVRDDLPGLAKQKGLAAIVRSADYHSDSVEPVDVTDDLVALFKPDKQTLKLVQDLRTRKPLAIEEVARMPANP